MGDYKKVPTKIYTDSFFFSFEGCRAQYKGIIKRQSRIREVESKSRENCVKDTKPTTEREGECLQLRMAG